MSRIASFSLSVLFLYAASLAAQSPASGQNLSFAVSAGQPWLDTGLALSSGDSLDISASAAEPSSGTTACDPKGIPSAASAGLPAPLLPPGALLARLNANAATPLLVGASLHTHIVEPSHLFLRLNAADASLCQGAVQVTVRTNVNSTDGQKSRGAQLKSQLSNAAQIFMAGQFGAGSTEPNANHATSDNASDTPSTPAPVLEVSSAPLDRGLRRKIDALPRRVNDQLQNLGDMVNFIIVGNQKDVQDALSAASWHVADTDDKKAVMNAIEQAVDSKDYLAMPMSTLYLFGRRQDYGYEMAEPIAMVASRHHFRIWKTEITYKGEEVWCGAGTHDIGFAKDKRNNSVTHKIDPAVDGERDNIAGSLQKAAKVQSLAYYLPPDPVQDARNATGDGYHSDGRLIVIFLK